MEEKKLVSLERELQLKKFQFNYIYEFASCIYYSFKIEDIIRVFFSTLMGQLGITRIFLLDLEKNFLKEKGLKITSSEVEKIKNSLKKIKDDWFWLKTDDLTDDFADLIKLFNTKKIQYMVNLSELTNKKIILGLSAKFNKVELSQDEIEFSYFISKFALIAIENSFLITKIIETERIEHEMKIAQDIQLSLLPQQFPQLKNFEISVIYKPINEVGGDYYDILKNRNGLIPVMIADVEGKGLPAALMAASSQAIFHSLNELYFFEPAKFISKANSLIYDFTKGNKFITLFWMLLDDNNKKITYVNAGHISPFLLSRKKVTKLTKGGLLTGFIGSASYEKETISLKCGDILVIFTDGVTEVENPKGREFGVESIISFVGMNRNYSAQEMTTNLFRKITQYSRNQSFRDDFTLIILKVK